MHRRAYLTLLTAALAGCSSSDETSTPTETAASTPTASDTPTAADTPTATPTETATETETATPTEQAKAANHIDAADGHLQDAVAAYTASADGSGLLSANGSVEPDVNAVTDALEKMTGELDVATEHANADQQATIDDLGHLGTFLGDAVAIQADLYALWADADAGTAAGISESFSELDERLSEMQNVDSAVSGALDEFDANSPGATSSTDAISESEYTGKPEQFAAERSTAQALRNALSKVKDGMGDFAGGVDNYTSGDFSNAEVSFWSAHSTFQGARDALSEEPATAYESMVSDFDAVLATLETVSDKMRRSAKLGREVVTEDEVQSLLQDSSLAANSPSAGQLLEWLQNR